MKFNCYELVSFDEIFFSNLFLSLKYNFFIEALRVFSIVFRARTNEIRLSYVITQR